MWFTFFNASQTFLYFAFGSNLLSSRIHVNNPSAKRVGIGELKDYRLDFNGFSKRWQGAPATVVPEEGSIVWGALWEISIKDRDSLDKQEGVPDGMYRPITVKIIIPDGRTVEARCYELVNPPEKHPLESLPPDRQPSKVYLDTMIKGAMESCLPKHYIEKLKNIKTNGYDKPPTDL